MINEHTNYLTICRLDCQDSLLSTFCPCIQGTDCSTILIWWEQKLEFHQTQPRRYPLPNMLQLGKTWNSFSHTVSWINLVAYTVFYMNQFTFTVYYMNLIMGSGLRESVHIQNATWTWIQKISYKYLTQYAILYMNLVTWVSYMNLFCHCTT